MKMYYCDKCGNKLDAKDQNCNRCGLENPYYVEDVKIENVKEKEVVIVYKESPALSTLAVIFAFFHPIIGFILSIVGLTCSQDKKYKTRCEVSLIISILVLLCLLIIYSLKFFKLI